MAAVGQRNGPSSAMNGSSSSSASRTVPRVERSSSQLSRSTKTDSASPALRRTSTGSSQRNGRDESAVAGRVRVVVRLRPRNAEEVVADADFADCVELQPELKRLRLRKNNWDCETYQFDEILTESASQKRVYEVVAKPVVESVLEGYNGTIMAYGQTGTGKTFTVGRLGEEDPSYRGIMVRAMEEIMADISPENDSVSMSYLQLYMETVQDLLAPENDNIPIVEDPKSGDVSLPGATLVEIWEQRNFEELLRVGEANRIAANTRLNTESSRSHAILMVHVKKVMKPTEKDLAASRENGNGLQSAKDIYVPKIRKSKLIVVDLAGSERINKSGSEGHALEEAKYINLSLTSLGKCINALAENSPHVPTRDSKLTRILRDSFGGSARTSLVITIGPSPRHRGETSSTILFGQRAMKVENMVKLKEEFDYKSLCRRLEMEVDRLIAENERQSKSLVDAEEEMSRELEIAKADVIEAETKLKSTLDKLAEEKSRYEKELSEMAQKLEIERTERERVEKEAKQNSVKKGADRTIALNDEVMDLKLQLETERQLREVAERELRHVKPSDENDKFRKTQNQEIVFLTNRLEEEIRQRAKLEDEINSLRTQLLSLSSEANETRKTLEKSSSGRLSFSSDTATNAPKSNQKATITKLFEQVGLQKILSLLASEDADVRVHAVKVVANLAAEEANQEKIVEAGGLSSLLMLLESSEDETIRRVAAGAVANLAMNETNQERIMSQGGVWLLSKAADEAEDPQTLRMVAGAIANLCGNEKLQGNLRDAGGVRALLGMVRCRHLDVLAQVARGIANFAKCESRATSQGSSRRRKSFLIEDGALPWLVSNVTHEASHIRRHIELALCHLAQNEANAKDLVTTGALWQIVRVSRECSRDDIRSLALRTLSGSPTFQSELRRLNVDCSG